MLLVLSRLKFALFLGVHVTSIVSSEVEDDSCAMSLSYKVFSGRLSLSVEVPVFSNVHHTKPLYKNFRALELSNRSSAVRQNVASHVHTRNEYGLPMFILPRSNE